MAAMRKKDIVPLVMTQLDLEHIILSEVSQKEKALLCELTLFCS